LPDSPNLLAGINARQLAEGVHDALLILDPDTEEVLDANERACAMYGIPREEFIGSSLRSLSLDIDYGADQVRQTLGVSRFHQFRTRQRRRDDAEMLLEIHATAIQANGRLAILSINRDVTESEALRERLMRSAEEWQSTVDAIRRPIAVVDKRGIVVRANVTARELARDVGCEEFVGRHVEEVTRYEAWMRATDLVGLVRVHGVAMSAQFTDPRTKRTWDLQASPVAGDEDRDVVIAARDITDIVEMEASIRRNEKLAELGHLVAGVAHEVRNPLFIISASFEALEARLQNVDAVSKTHMQNLHDQIERLSRLMNELLDYGRPPTLDIALAPFDDAIRAAAHNAMQAAQANGVELRNEFPPGLPPVLMELPRLAGAIENLLNNAIQHTPAGKTVVINGGLFNVHDRKWMYCDIDDSGPGFRDGDAERVFEPFFTTRRGGTGLGLSIVKRTIELHGGCIHAETRPEGGGRLRLELPLPQ